MKQIFDVVAFLNDYNINSRPRAEWLNVKCPFCSDREDHLGIHPPTGACTCWRCGRHKLVDVIKALTNASPTLLAQIKGKYGIKGKRPLRIKTTPLRRGSVKLPPGIVPDPPQRALEYLANRGYDPEKLITEWGLKFTGPTGPYKFRIIAPIYHAGRLVSYQGRDYTGNQELKYKACRKENETRDHQTCLYGSWLAEQDIIVVEGIADAWRFGAGAVAVFGVSYTVAQVRLLCKYRRLFLVFDGEPEAIARAEKLAEEILAIEPNKEVQIIELDGGDPGEMKQNDADYLKKTLLNP